MESMHRFFRSKQGLPQRLLPITQNRPIGRRNSGCLLYTSDAADEGLGVDLGGRRIIKKKKRGEGWREGVGGGARRQSGSERLFCFFFQAEDGIRDLVRSRGLGDVYKRQLPI